MKVTILNPEALKNLYENHGKFACVCYNTPEKYAERVGKACQADNHMSGSRCEYIKFHISDVDRGTAEQCLRHEIGVDVPYEFQDNYSFADYSEMVKDVPSDHIVKNMASFRYIDKDGFKWETPALIAACEDAKAEYDFLMRNINDARRRILNYLVEDGNDIKAANEAANYVLPRSTMTEFVIGFTPEALIHFMHKRLCFRAQEKIYSLAVKMKYEIAKVNPRFAMELVPQCQHLLWCPEGKRSCGLKPTKEKVMDLIEKGREVE